MQSRRSQIGRCTVLGVVADASASGRSVPASGGRKLAVGLGTAAAAVPAAQCTANAVRFLAGGASGGGTFAADGGGGGGGGSGGSFSLMSLAPPPASAEEEDDDDEEAAADDEEEFLCEGVKAINLPQGPGIPTQSELFEGLNCRKGATCSRKGLSDDLNALLSTGLFQNVDANVQPSDKGYIVEFVFKEKVWPRMESFKVTGATILPTSIADDVLNEAQKSDNVTVRTLAAAKNIVEGYYQDRGITFGTIKHFDGMETGNVVAHVIEGQITRVNLVFVDDSGNEVGKSTVNPKVVYGELPIKSGQLYNLEEAKRGLQDISTLQLFENVQIQPKPDENEPSKVALDVVLKERPVKTAEMELEWGISPGPKGKPDLTSLTPGGSAYIEHRNLDGDGTSLSASLSTTNFLAPQDDLGFRIEYTVPRVFGDDDENRTKFKAAAFNSRKASPAYCGGPTMDEVPGVWIDRSGGKLSLMENYTRQSRCSYGLVLQEVTARDESGGVCVSGSKTLPNGSTVSDGPATTWSPEGTDRVASTQASFSRDNTRFINGATVGPREILHVDQTLGFGPTAPLNNRHSLSCTRFIQLASPPKRSEMPPPVLVLHGKVSNAVGDLPTYDAYTLGGPNSCRGYGVGELGVSRRSVETAAEARVPVPKLNCHAFAFYEHVDDLGGSKEVSGNPSAYYRRAGAGSCYGAGVRVGPVRAEWAQDCNRCKGNWFLRFGERF